jgi:simple sugar transport system permease protein
MIEDFIHTTITMMTPILLAAIGGLYTDLSGMLNIGLEGMMLISAFISVYVTSITQNILLGILAGIGISVFLGFVMGYLSLKLRANVFVAGLATNLFAAGITVFLSDNLCGSKGTIFFQNAPKLSVIEIPIIDKIPFFGRIFSGYNALTYLSIILLIVSFYLIFRTPYGYHLRAVGKNEKTAHSVGISIFKHRMIAFLVSGLFAGLGGAALSLPLQTFVGGMTNGRGWIALVAVVLSQGNPIGLFISSFIFGAASAFSNILQALTTLSPKLLLTLPFVITLVAMIIFSARRNKSYE